MPRYIFVTGGVVSSVGKGITAAAIGRVMKARGVSVSIQKLDPYLNVDPGTMSPYQHGEVYVTADGAETDLDLGHYERFIDQDLTGASSVTTGQIYSAIIQKERRGDFLGGTIQSVPHVTNEIKARVREVARRSGADLIIVEVGGTVGDIEGQPFIEAIRQLRKEEGHDNTLAIHVTLLPHISTTNELKTKPTQHSVRELRSMGISPDVIVTRSDFPVPQETKDKIALFCDVEKRAVIPLQTVPTIYQVPLVLQESGLGDYIIERLGLPAADRDLAEWHDLVDRLRNPQHELQIAVVGKYVELHDAYLSVKESLIHAGVHRDAAVRIRWIHAEEMEHEGSEELIEGVDGVVVPGGFGERGIEGKIRAAKWARENNVPYLGLCLGMQVMVIEFARNVLGLAQANSTEFDEGTPDPIISMLSEQLGIVDKGGTMRLGEYPCVLVPGTRAAAVYGVPEVRERHRHRYEFNNAYLPQLNEAGLIASGMAPDRSLVEISELRDHPWMVGSQFHPEFRSRPTRPHPLFAGLVGAALERKLSSASRSQPSPQLV